MSLKGIGLKKRYGKRLVVKELEIELHPGEIVGLLGPNGAGKTTTFYILVGLIKPDGGRVIINNIDVTDEPMHKRARLGLGYLPQEPSIFRKLTVLENLLAILEFRKLSKNEMEIIAERLIEELGLGDVRNQKGYTLSGGERRKVEIARALASEPSYILLDEPFAAIDPKTVEELQRIIFKLKEKGIGILVTDHNIREVLSITDRAYIIYDGQILISGSSGYLISDARAKEVYLGEKFSMS
ncbi:MAG: LPS export ABC transporter ATP-binding protein [bacterium]